MGSRKTRKAKARKTRRKQKGGWWTCGSGKCVEPEPRNNTSKLSISIPRRKVDFSNTPEVKEFELRKGRSMTRKTSEEPRTRTIRRLKDPLAIQEYEKDTYAMGKARKRITDKRNAEQNLAPPLPNHNRVNKEGYPLSNENSNDNSDNNSDGNENATATDEKY